MEAVTSSPLFGIVLSILAYAVGVWLNRKAKTPLVNPLLVAIILVALVLLAFHIPWSTTRQAGISSPCFWLPLPPLWPCPFTGSGNPEKNLFRCSWAAPPAHLLLCSACMGYAGPLDWTKS